MYRIIPLLDRAMLFLNGRLIAERKGHHGAVSALLAYCDSRCILVANDPRPGRKPISASGIVTRALADQPTVIDGSQHLREKLEKCAVNA
jgi:hypothetical protein